MRLLLQILALAVAGAANAQGTFEAIVVNFSSDTALFMQGTAGWTFQPTTNISVTELGAFNYLLSGQDAIPVGIWTAGGTLIASNSITTNSPVLNQTRYQSITPVPLNPGQTYHIGAFVNGVISPNILGNGLGDFAPGPGILIGGYAVGTNGFSFPSPIPGGAGYILQAPNFRYTGNVPEPAAFAFLCLGTLALVLWPAGRRC